MAYNWIKVEADYITDPTHTTKTLSDKYGIPEGTIATHMAKHKWVDKRNMKTSKVKEKTIEKATERAINQAAQFCSEDLKISIEIRNKIAKMIDSIDSPSEINSLSQAADKAQKIGRLALGLTTSNEGMVDIKDPLDELTNTEQFLKDHGVDPKTITH